MKTIQTLNYSELSFFTGKSIIDCKNDIARILDIDEVTSKGHPAISSKDRIDVSDYNFTIKSNSNLEGVNQLDYLINHYSKGTTINRLYSFSSNKSFIKQLKFTGGHSVLNTLLNRGQLLKLQKTWLTKNISSRGNKYISKKAKEFINNNEWASSYLDSIGISTNQRKVI